MDTRTTVRNDPRAPAALTIRGRLETTSIDRAGAGSRAFQRWERVREKWTKKLTRGAIRLLGMDAWLTDQTKRLDRVGAVDRQNQMLLWRAYRDGTQLPEDWREIEFRSFSQNGEDGVLLYLLSQVGMATRRSVEIGCSSGVECNSANLIVNHGYRGLLLDARATKLARGRRFYAGCRDTRHRQPTLVDAWITRENVERLVASHGFAGEIDVLSIDLDGMDYWVWEALRVVKSRIVVMEYNARFGPDQAITLEHRADYRGENAHFGASLAALVELGRRKGYRLVGCEQHRINAFFVRDGLAEDTLPEVDLAPFVRRQPLPTPTGWVRVRKEPVRRRVVVRG